jgi:CD109 antigen
MAAAEEDDDGLHWSAGGPEPLPIEEGRFAPFPGQMSGSTDIEATGYATLALIEHGDPVNAGRAAKWLVGHRNSMGGFGSTQDTVVALQALTRYAADAASDTTMTVTVSAGGETQEVQITAANFDVLQTVEIPAGVPVTLTAEGKGQAVFQAVSRFNLPEAEEEESVFDITVDYDTTQVSVNDTVTVDVSLTFQPPVPGTAGMIVLDVSVPTGFAPVTETLDALVAADAKVKRYDVAGRKVILYIEDMAAGETIGLSFDVVAQYPVQGKGATSQAYSYYTPEWRGETISEAVTVE